MKTDYSVVDLDRVVKFLDGLNKLSAQHAIGLTVNEDYEIVLATGGQKTPFALNSYDTDTLSVVVSL